MRFSPGVLRYFCLTVLLGLAATLVAGCGSKSGAEAQPNSQVDSGARENIDVSPVALTGTSWLLNSLGGGDDQVAALDGVQTTLGFLTDRYGGNGGCNYYVGVFSAEGSDLTLETPARTAASCMDTPESLTQESVFVSALATVASFGINGDTLEMYSSSDQLMLTMSPIEPVSLADTLWRLRFANVETQWVEPLDGTEITLRMANGTLSGSAGCNEYKANVTVEAGALSVTDLTFTEKGCVSPEGVMEQETAYLSMLGEAALLRKFPVSLQILDVDGVPLFFFGADTEAIE